MMALNAVKEQCGVGRLWAAKAGDRQGLVVTAGGSGRTRCGDGAKPLALGISMVGVFLWACPLVLAVGIQRGDGVPSWVHTHGAWGSHAPQETGARQGLEMPRFTPGRAMALRLVSAARPSDWGGFPSKVL